MIVHSGAFRCPLGDMITGRLPTSRLANKQHLKMDSIIDLTEQLFV
jgi:hypothetical protein